MINIYNKNGIQIDICYDYGYFEINPERLSSSKIRDIRKTRL